MKRETKANLIFLIALIAIVTPGAIIVVRKQFQPGAKPLDMRDPVNRQIPYMVPYQTPQQIERYIPQQTFRWLQQLAIENTGQGVFLRNDRPVISADHQIQLLTCQTTDQQTTTLLLAWDGDPLLDSVPINVLSSSPAGQRQGAITLRQRLPIPKDIAQELIKGGYAKPPQHIVLIRATFPENLSTAQPAELLILLAGPSPSRIPLAP